MTAQRQREIEYEISREPYAYDGNLALRQDAFTWQQERERYEYEQQLQVRRQAKARPKLRAARLTFVCLLSFACAFGVLFMQTLIQQNNLVLSDLRSQIKTEEKETKRLALEVVLAEDIELIRKTAVEKFHMTGADEGQIITVDLDGTTASAQNPY